MTDIAQLSLRDVLDIIWQCEFDGHKGLRRRVNDICERCSLSLPELKILSWLLHNIGNFTDEPLLENDPRFSGVSFYETVESLKKKGLVYWAGDYYEIDLKEVDNCRFLKPEYYVKPRLTADEFFLLLKDSVCSLVEQDYLDMEGFMNRTEPLLTLSSDLPTVKGYLDLSERHSLGPDERAALLVLADSFVRRGTAPLSCGEGWSERRAGLSRGLDTLVHKGLAVIVPEAVNTEYRNDSDKDRYLISHDACRALFRDCGNLIDYKSLSHQADVIRCESIEPRELYFDDSACGEVETLRQLVDERNFSTIIGRLERGGLRRGITCLLYGPPGTGKTELCRQLARASGRDIIIADAAKINGSLWGEDEKNVRELFRNYLYLNAISSKAPLFLLNEADGILSNRTSGRSGAERSQNIVQTILLQEMERFEGLFFATTNMEANLDDAFYRRFLFKIRLGEPPAEIRKKIWKAQIPELSDEEALGLSRDFRLTGGQIANVAMRCVIHDALSDTTSGKMEIRSFCEDEVRLSHGNASRVHIKGFREYYGK